MKALVITLRGLPLAYVGCYGNDWVETPALDTLAAEGVVFDRHYSDRPDAAGARRAWRTGRYHFPLPDGADASWPAAADLLALLRENGVATRLLLDPRHSTPAEFTAGWDAVTEVRPADSLRAIVLSALEQLAGAPRWLLWIDLAGLLPPWEVPAELLDAYFHPQEAGEDEADEDLEVEELEPLPNPPVGPLASPADETFLRIQRTCAAAVTHLDAAVGDLWREWRQRGLHDEALLLLTSDHGQALGEHGIVGPYRPWLHDELIHLPLILRMPGAAEAGRRVFALTQPVDVMPTLLDAFGVPPPAPHGHSLLPLARGEVEKIRPYACSGLRCGEAAEWALRTPEWAFLLPVRPHPDDGARQPQLYVKPDDRWEVNNVVQHHLDLADHLERVLRAFVGATGQPGPLQAPELPDVGGEQAGA
ncbi:MAG TPA: sulfatase-like hydrolase/transferase [Gemmataceae bacterium]|nr:sulfatase-like hydrolase/transferase [Gemmataceae bacterium]